jgi:NAD-dependent deacetylase
LQVYPAAGLINYTKPKIPIYVIDPKQIIIKNMRFQIIQEKAETGVEHLIKILNTKI